MTGMNKDSPDNDAMCALRGGNDGALDVLMGAWKDRIAAYLYRMLGNYHDAAELAQEAFVKVYFEKDRFDVNKAFGPWIYTIAGNLARNRLRWRSRHKSGPLDEELPHEQPVQGLEESGPILKCLQDLPTEYREVLVLFEIEEKSHLEIAQIIGKSRKTVESRLYKARELLKKAYETCVAD